jgi:hypothetical protein
MLGCLLMGEHMHTTNIRRWLSVQAVNESFWIPLGVALFGGGLWVALLYYSR